MTSKEAIKIIETYNYWNGAEEITGNTCINPVYIETKKQYNEAKDILEKDLEILEILKKYYKSNGWSNGGVIQFWEMTEPQLKKVNERLENDTK